MRRCFVVVGLLLVSAGMAVAQEYPKIETAPAFMYIHTSPPFGGAGNQSFNCLGAGGTLAYNLSSLLGIAADLGGCKLTNLSNTFGVGSQVSANEFTFLFGPRLTFRGSSMFEPFVEVNFGGVRLSANCHNNTNCANQFGTGTYSKTAFGLTAGGGFQIKLSRKISLRPVQAEYLYTRFGNNGGGLSGNQSQNSFRLKSGIVIGWGGSAKK